MSKAAVLGPVRLVMRGGRERGVREATWVKHVMRNGQTMKKFSNQYRMLTVYVAHLLVWRR